ncbi:hypothetical protein DLAC_00545 [Tieghemostelium lacteum]|uniref:Nuclear envelope membrane protein n=1 Tax=Tieghemostelium lacteum TaxID=361077 RepID=A0A152AA20_TIELA|nr:hypothetical protein DLAC_00545 [Tieghemostelium lacteum]|eukprot:KYR03054.1 hypothetical protein DLAC_00545 [Tieghemostelium lacteum]
MKFNDIKTPLLNKQDKDSTSSLLIGEEDIYNIVIDICLLVMFILQHSLIKCDLIRSVLPQIVPFYITRILYNASASINIVILINIWKPCSLVIWELNREFYQPLFHYFKLIGTGIMIIEFIGYLEIFEFLGIKQFISKIEHNQTFNDNQYKRVILEKIRHPNAIGFILLLWSNYRMTLDLFALCTFFTLYLFITPQISADNKALLKQSYK